MNKNIIYIVIAGLFMLSSCGKDFLSPAPVSSIGSETFYTNDIELETGVVNMYDGIKGINSTVTDDNHGIQVEYQITEMRSDNTKTKSSEGEQAQFEQFAVQPTNGVVADYYRSFYNVIYRANVVLANIGAAESEATANQFEGEARFVRAYAYFNLVRLFGEIPLVDHIIPPTDETTPYDRRPVSEVYDLIVSDLTTAEAKLSSTIGNTYKGRASAGAAQALLAKVYLTLGQYADAQAMCEKVINSGDFSLEPNFNDVFYTERNNEIIFAIEYNGGVNSTSQNFSSEWMNAVGRTSGINYVTPEAVAALDALGGDRTQYSYREDLSQAGNYQVVKYLPNGEDGGADGKTFNADPTTAGNDWIVLRYADVLLMHVEAIMGANPVTGDAAALVSFQAVRDRAGLTTPVVGITKDELLDERRVELAFEDQRLFDLIRFGVAESVLGQFATDNGYLFSPTDLLLPIPQSEIGLSKGQMGQNPGY